MAQKLEGKVAIVTGAANGIGRATAELFRAEGARLVVVDMSGQGLCEKFQDMEGVAQLEQDVTDEGAASAIVKLATDSFGGIDILVNNAGICVPGTIEELDDAMWEKQMAVNITSMFRITREAVPYLKKSDKGRIINVGSIMSDMAGPGLCAYGTSKHAVAGFTKSLAVDLGQYQITANYLQPGSIITAMSEPFMEDEAFRTYWETKAPIGRLGTAEEVASAALYLAMPEAQFVTGLGFNVDGGAIVNF